jgi:hypothetical protein
LDHRGRRLEAVAAIAVAAGLGILQLKVGATPQIDAAASARTLGHQIAAHPGQVCLGNVRRNWDYGLAYYAGYRLPACEVDPKPWEVAPEAPDGAVLQPKP